MARPIIEIPKEEIPSQEFSVMILEPNFGTYRDARKRFPYPTNNNNVKPGYNIDELLFAICFVGVNGKAFAKDSRDVIERIERFSIEDKQFLVEAFLEAYFLPPAAAKEARSVAQELVLADRKLSYTLDKNHLPSGQHSVTFFKPTIGTQMQADRAHQGPEVNGCSMEEMLLSMCITHIDGKEVAQGTDPVALLNEFEIADVQYLQIAFINMFILDDTGTEKAKSLGKRLRQKTGLGKPVAKTKSTSEITTTTAAE